MKKKPVNLFEPSQQQLNDLLKYYQTKQYDKAEELALSITEEFPKHPFSWKVLAAALKQNGKISESLVAGQKSVQLDPQDAEAYYNLGVVLQELGRLDEAEAIYKKAITLKPDFVQAIKNKWLLLFSQKRFEEALLDADLCISKGSRELDLTTLYALGKIDEIYKRLEVRSKIDGENMTIAAFASFIAEVEKKNTAYNFCPNPIDFVHHANLSTYINDSNSYIDGLIHELDSVKKIWQPSKKTTVGGFQTLTGLNLFESPTGKVEQLKSIILNELDVYQKKYSNKSCSYIKKWPSQNYLNAWYVVLKKQGYQNPHIHPGGWLSGVIYLKVVPSLDKNEGAIEFSLNGEYYSNINSSKLIHQPKLGDIVFFPSSLYHRTIPFSTNTDRIIVSFDLKPKQF